MRRVTSASGWVWLRIHADQRQESGRRWLSRDIITVDFSNNKLDGSDDLQPASGSYLHIWLYTHRPEARSAIHVHPEPAVLLSNCDKQILPIYGACGPGARRTLNEIPVHQRSITIHDDRLGEDFATCMSCGAKLRSYSGGPFVNVV